MQKSAERTCWDADLEQVQARLAAVLLCVGAGLHAGGHGHAVPHVAEAHGQRLEGQHHAVLGALGLAAVAVDLLWRLWICQEHELHLSNRGSHTLLEQLAAATGMAG